MKEDLTKTIVITGASSGIGRSLAEYYAQKGQRLFLSGRNGDRLEQVKKVCIEIGAPKCDIRAIDVSNRTAMKEWLEEIATQTPIDILYANAGISGGTGSEGKIRDYDLDLEIFNINLIGVLNTIHPVLPSMISRKEGQIVILSSMASFAPLAGAPAYSASKVAVRFYGEALAAKLKSSGVHLSVVCPGFVESRMTEENDFPMPFMMPASEAAEKIAKAVAKHQIRIDFPWQMRLIMGFIKLFPDAFVREIFARAPEKPSKKKKKG